MKNSKPASAYSSRYSEGVAQLAEKPNRSKLDTLDPSIGAFSKSAGGEQVKTSGIKIRGTGAATKGTLARGPMA